MKQLVQLQKQANDFKSLGAELLFIFREESDGVDGLRMIKKNHPNDFVLAIDTKKKTTRAYSNGRMEFDNYVVDSSGIVRGIIDGTLRERATAMQLLKVLNKIQND